jgi:hypothetical protein
LLGLLWSWVASRQQWALLADGRSFCETLLPRLEEFKRTSGTYPPSIESVLLPSDALPPILLDPSNRNVWYRPDESGHSFMFLINQQGGGDALFAPTIYYYDSDSGTGGGASSYGGTQGRRNETTATTETSTLIRVGARSS